MDLYLVRHGETIDNVSGLYAGVRDSPLTVHGVEQARRLGEYLATEGVKFTHVFASPLSRAFKTTQAITSAQQNDGEDELDIHQVPDLIEQNFGYYEGKPFQARSDPKKTGREAHREKHQHEPDFVDVESKDSMNKRADTFLDEHILPLFRQCSASNKLVIAVVSHGMLLSHLWRRILRLLPLKSVAVDPNHMAARGPLILEHLGGWSNTGYLDLAFSQEPATVVKTETEPVSVKAESPDGSSGSSPTDTKTAGPAAGNRTDTIGTTTTARAQSLVGWTVLIRSIDKKDHLLGLKRQRGGIGRTAHDEKQQKINGFFKRPKLDE